MMWEPITILPLAFCFFHQGRWAIFIISARIHLQGWLTGSGSSCLRQDQTADGWDGTLGLAPLVGMELHWKPSLRVGHGESISHVVVEIKALYCSMVSPLARKRVMPRGNVGSPPSSSSMLNLTCVFGFSSIGVGALLLDSQVLDCNFRSLIWRQSCTPAALDLEGLGEGGWDCPWHYGEGLWCHLDLLLLLNWECCLCDPDCPIRGVFSWPFCCLPSSWFCRGESVCKVEWPWEHFLPLESPAKPGVPCKPALDIHQFNSCLSSLIQSSCCQWEITLGANLPSSQ